MQKKGEKTPQKKGEASGGRIEFWPGRTRERFPAVRKEMRGHEIAKLAGMADAEFQHPSYPCVKTLQEIACLKISTAPHRGNTICGATAWALGTKYSE